MEPHQELERRWAEWNQLDPAGMVACSSGTAALHLALEAMQLPPTSYVVLPDFTMIACARAVALASLRPAFVDCCREDLLMNIRGILPMDVVRMLGAVLVVHIYGRRFDVERISGLFDVAGRFAGRRPFVVEDLAEAHGVRPHRTTDAACWSFYRNKIVHGEEGGAVWFRDPAHAALARQLRCLGFTDSHDFQHVPRGHNYRLANSLAKLVLNDIDDVTLNVHIRRIREQRLDEVVPPAVRMPKRDAPWVWDCRLPTREMRDAAFARLREAGLNPRLAFKPMSLQAEFCRASVIRGKTHEAAAAADTVLYLPLNEPDRAEVVGSLLGSVLADAR